MSIILYIDAEPLTIVKKDSAVRLNVKRYINICLKDLRNFSKRRH